MSKKISIGMDVGTTNSAVSYALVPTASTIIDIKNSRSGILPSCVKYLSRTEVEVGISSYDERYSNAVVYSMKRHMQEGYDYKEKVIAENGEEFEVTPIEVTSHVIRTMYKAAVEKFGADAIEKVTITVPAYFSEVARHNTVLAAVEAGIAEENIYLINEPTSASISYGLQGNTKFESVLVYDLGGGTFDVTVLTITQSDDGPIYNVITSDGNAQLGGDDIDIELLKTLEVSICAELEYEFDQDGTHGLRIDSLNFSDVEKETLQLFCESAKKAYASMSKSFTVEDRHFDENTLLQIKETGATLPHEMNIVINFKEIDNAYKTILLKADETTKAVMTRSSTAINKIILVGGSTKATPLQKFLKSKYPNIPVKAYTDPDLSVAEGASIYTLMQTSGQSSRLNDVIQLPIGVAAIDTETNREFVKLLIAQDQHLPTESMETFNTLIDNQEEMTIGVYQGASRYPQECTFLGNLVLTDLPPGKAGTVHAQVNLTVDINGLLKLKVTQFTDVAGQPTKVYEKDLTRLSSNSGESQAPKVDAKSKIYNRRIQFIHSKMQTPAGLEKALEEFEKIKVEPDKVIANFLNTVGKYDDTNSSGKSTDRIGEQKNGNETKLFE